MAFISIAIILKLCHRPNGYPTAADRQIEVAEHITAEQIFAARRRNTSDRQLRG